MTSTWPKLVTHYVNFLNRYRIASFLSLLAVVIVTVVFAPKLLSSVSHHFDVGFGGAVSVRLGRWCRFGARSLL